MVEEKSHVALQSSGTTVATAKADTHSPLHHHPKADYFYEDTFTILQRAALDIFVHGESQNTENVLKHIRLSEMSYPPIYLPQPFCQSL